MPIILFLLALFFPVNLWAACGDIYCVGSGPTTCTATDATKAVVEATIDEALLCTAPLTVVIPAESKSWTAGISKTITKDMTIQGAGSSLSGTVLTGSGIYQLFSLTINTGINFYLSNIRFVSSAMSASNGVVSISGQSKLIRIHDNYFDATAMLGGRALQVFSSGATENAGVIYNNTFVNYDAGQGFSIRMNTSPIGPETVQWGANTNVWYVENNTFTRHGGGESGAEVYSWGRGVFRYNNLFNSYIGTHGFDSDQGSINLIEVYLNTHTGDGTNGGWTENIRGGTGLLWGNTYDTTYGSGIKLEYYRSCVATFNTPTTPIIESTDIDTDTITSAAHGLTENETIQFVGGTAPLPVVSSPSSSATRYYVKNKTDNTLQVSTTPGGSAVNLTASQSGTVYIYHGQCDGDNTKTETYGNSDGNSDATGYPCVYQVGRTGANGITLSPVYSFLNTRDGVSIGNYLNANFISPACAGTVTLSDHVKNNRDYFSPDAVNCPSKVDATTSCTKGVGIGTLAQRPDKCSNADYATSFPGPAWWATDTKKLYSCTAADTWTEIFTPYTCPHPLTGLTGSCLTDTAGTGGYNQMVARKHQFPTGTMSFPAAGGKWQY